MYHSRSRRLSTLRRTRRPVLITRTLRTRTRSIGYWPPSAAVAAVAMLVGAANVGQLTHPTRLDEHPTVVSVVSPAPSQAPEEPAPVEGREFSYISKVSGRPIHWPCESPIWVTVEGPAPDGADQAVEDVVLMLRTATGLDLRGRDGADQGGNVIDVHYVPRGTVDGPLELVGDKLGVAGPEWSATTGIISRGTVLIRNDTRETSPLLDSGKLVLLHEIGHTLGLGHSSPTSQGVMPPELSSTTPLKLSAGDLLALASLGCRS